MKSGNKINEYKKSCLKNLSDKDLLLLIKSFATKRHDYEDIADLIRGDNSIINSMLDSDQVFTRIMHSGGTILNVSPYFLFSLILRKTLREKRNDSKFVEKSIDELNNQEPLIPWNKKRIEDLLSDEQVANYIANMLTRFTKSSGLFKVEEDDDKSYHYITDMIADSLYCDYIRKFNLYCHIGDYTLFLMGMAPEYIEQRFKYKKHPDKSYYITFGKMFYNMASEHSTAKENDLSDTLWMLSEGFEILAQLLRLMKKEYLFH